ncbi:MAG: AMP-binding protein, partial [Xanthomonadales bacterium]|nr:AMP-binding protein [Xanthomonadales bacterium]NIN76003.1 AMP-binding protein [Xanthomonadales bacterium]NIO13639.1 AMP-binding protein [Xanthomonadales bacterium]NIP13042.1 AMP-binding protein [Xanthomonadales bacterium]NIQ36780.1 AMP-binding protein [Xanthomonadales bacterium]
IEVTTLGDLLLRAADRHGDRDAIIFPDARLTYGQLRERAYERARSLLALGVDRGDHVGILMPNCLDYVECLFAVQLLGAMAVPVNARYKARELAYVVENADLSADPDQRHHLRVRRLRRAAAGSVPGAVRRRGSPGPRAAR